jgi:hypothetical protein
LVQNSRLPDFPEDITVMTAHRLLYNRVESS